MPCHERFERIARSDVLKSNLHRHNISAMIVKVGKSSLEVLIVIIETALFMPRFQR